MPWLIQSSLQSIKKSPPFGMTNHTCMVIFKWLQLGSKIIIMDKIAMCIETMKVEK